MPAYMSSQVINRADRYFHSNCMKRHGLFTYNSLGALKPGIVEGRNKAIGTGAAFLDKTVFYAEADGIIHKFIVFPGGKRAVQFGIGFYIQELRERRVLVHNTDVYLVTISVV